MKPRSAVAALLTVTETLLAARAKAARTQQARARQASRDDKAEKVAEIRPLLLRIRAQAIS